MNILLCSVGRRGKLVQYFKRSLSHGSRIIAIDSSPYAPALYLADRQYIVPNIHEPEYVETVLKICQQERVDAITTFIDPEIELLAAHRADFEKAGALVLAPYHETARLCFDKFLMYRFLTEHHIPTGLTFQDLPSFKRAFLSGEISFPVFVKPRTGSGSVGARKIVDMQGLKAAMKADASLIIQEWMLGKDIDADIYVDTVSHKLVSAFSKRKLSTTLGGANKTVSFKDDELLRAIQRIVDVLQLNGPNDMDFFYQDGRYYLSEINPRFGGAYLHAYGAGVDFIKMIENNTMGKENRPDFDGYEDGSVMMMYDSVVIKRKEDLIK